MPSAELEEPATSPVELEEPSTSPVTLRTLLSSDACLVIIDHLDNLADLAALWLCPLPVRPEVLQDAVSCRATKLLALAPLWVAADLFEQSALWPVAVAACDWLPRPFFATLRAPKQCKVTGHGGCSHGLCQKQETPKAGVLDLLVLLSTEESCSSLALEVHAWLCGALGRNDDAMRAWRDAAAAGSPRAQFDVGIRRYQSEGSASTLYHDPDAPLPAAPSSREDPSAICSAAALLRLASKNPTLPSLGLEGYVIEARSLMVLGMMTLDGDGIPQDDAKAFECFEGACRAVHKGRAYVEVHCHRSDKECTPLPAITTGPTGRPIVGEAAYAVKLLSVLNDVEDDAEEAMNAMDRFTFFANGRP